MSNYGQTLSQIGDPNVTEQEVAVGKNFVSRHLLRITHSSNLIPWREINSKRAQLTWQKISRTVYPRSSANRGKLCESKSPAMFRSAPVVPRAHRGAHAQTHVHARKDQLYSITEVINIQCASGVDLRWSIETSIFDHGPGWSSRKPARPLSTLGASTPHLPAPSINKSLYAGRKPMKGLLAGSIETRAGYSCFKRNYPLCHRCLPDDGLLDHSHPLWTRKNLYCRRHFL